MSTKRSHSKSRTGCKQCKSRRIKCDETPPCCANCAKKGLECEYQDFRDAFENIRLLTPASFGSSSNNASSSSQANTPTSGPPFSSPEPQSARQSPGSSFSLADLGHLHFFTLHTYQTLPVLPNEQYFQKWQYEVPAVAQSCPALMHAILGTAAAHQQSAIPENEQDPLLTNAVRLHYGRALNMAASNIHAQDAEIVLCFSILISILTLYLERQKPQPEANPIGDFVSLMQVLRAAKGLLNQAMPAIQQSSIGGTLMQHTWNRNPQTPDICVTMALDQLEALVARYGSTANIEHHEYGVLVDAVGKLRYFYTLTRPNPETWVYLMSWPIGLSPQFCALVQQRQPIALCVLAHWCVSMYNAPMRWFAGDWPKRLMLSLQQQLENTEWSDGMLWPLRETIYQAYS